MVIHEMHGFCYSRLVMIQWCFSFHGKHDAILRAYDDPSMIFAIPDGHVLSYM
jgi:hypothetical protein